MHLLHRCLSVGLFDTARLCHVDWALPKYAALQASCCGALHVIPSVYLNKHAYMNVRVTAAFEHTEFEMTI